MIRDRLYVSERRLRFVISVLAAAGTVALFGCGDRDNNTQPSSTQNAPGAIGGETTPTVTFDDLHGGLPIVMVYPGASNTEHDRHHSGTFNDGDVVRAICKVEGRTVHSDPTAGEEDRTSNEWIRIEGSPGKDQYATAVYIEDPSTVLEELSTC